jgi:hypothetical protein
MSDVREPDSLCQPDTGVNSEDLLRIVRGDDPNHPPMWNGLPRMTTPPDVPAKPMSEHGQLFEFLFPYPIHIFDSTDWPPLRIVQDGTEIYLLKPISTPVTATEQLAVGNESPDLYCSNVRAVVLKTFQGFPATHERVFEIVRDALQWMRVMSRQFWIGTGASGVAAASRGSAFSVDGDFVTQMNYALYGSTVLVRALPFRFWEPLGQCVSSGAPVPVSESIYCDALASFASGDSVRCLVELGVAVEIELTKLLDQIAAANPNADGVAKYHREKRELTFKARLLTATAWLHATNPKQFVIPNMPADWADQILSLYKFRSTAVHEGRAVIESETGPRPLAAGDLQSFIFSTEVLYRWSSAQRLKFRLPAPAASLDRSGQIIAILGDPLDRRGFVIGTSESSSNIEKESDSPSPDSNLDSPHTSE